MSYLKNADQYRATRERKTARSALILALVGVLWASVATASATEKKPSWFYGHGTHEIISGSNTVTRAVEGWVSEDGRYRVIVTTPDTGASEEVIFDGVAQRAIVTPHEGKRATIIGVTNRHFVVEAFQDILAKDQIDLTVDSLQSSAYGSEHLTMKWESIAGSADLLTPTDGVFPPIAQQESGLFMIGAEATAQSVGGQSRSHADSRTATMFGPSGACVEAYNFRNLSTGYFRGTSTKTGVCYYMMVALYKNSLAQGGGGFCAWNGYGGSSAALANFASHYTYTTPTYPADSNTCSAHTGWKSNWSQQVNARGMNGYPN